MKKKVLKKIGPPLILSERDRQRFLGTLSNPGKLTRALLQAAKRDEQNREKRTERLNTEEEHFLEQLAQRVAENTTKTIRAVDKTLAYCDASNARMDQLEAWMRERGYTARGEQEMAKKGAKWPIGLTKGQALQKAVENYIGTEAEAKELRAETQKLRAAVAEVRALFRSIKKIQITPATRRLTKLGGTMPRVKNTPTTMI